MGAPAPGPLRGLAMLSDCRTVAMVDTKGVISWLGLSGMGGPSALSSLLGGQGYFRVAPTKPQGPAKRRYAFRTNVLETIWPTLTGTVKVCDALVWTPERGSARTLVRVITCIEGTVEVDVECDLRFDYDTVPAEWRATTGRAASARWNELNLKLRTDFDVEFEGSKAHTRLTLEQGESAYIALGWGKQAPPSTLMQASRLQARTIRGWQRWLAGGTIPDHQFGPHLERAALVLKGLNFEPSGAFAAAATTSLPETPGGERNWDYRHAWVRDGCMMAEMLFLLGFRKEAERWLEFLMARPVRTDGLQIMYGLWGESTLTERELPHLPGFGGAVPVRIGNGAYLQRQNDVWGHVVRLIYLLHGDRIDDRTWEFTQALVEQALAARDLPDRGIWEVRGDPRQFTSSLVYLWVAFHYGSLIADSRREHEKASAWARAATKIKEKILTKAVDARGVFTASPGAEALDASCLLIPLLGFLPADDQRVRNTVHAIADELSRDGLILRYPVDEFDDGLAGDETTFVICTFWQVAGFALIGEPERALELFTKVVGYSGDVGLLAEEIDPRTGEHWGNTPQGFSHLGLILAVLWLIKAEARGDLEIQAEAGR